MYFLLDIFEQFSAESHCYSDSLNIRLGVLMWLVSGCLMLMCNVAMAKVSGKKMAISMYISSFYILFFLYIPIMFVALMYLPSYTTFNYAMVLAMGLVYLLYYTQVVSLNFLNNKLANIKLLVLYIKDLMEKTINVRAGIYMFLILETGLCLGVLNIMGIMPFSSSTTSQFILPFCLSLSFFLFNNMMGSLMHSFGMFNLFMPKGVPLFMTPLLLIMENISYFASMFSLSMSLCANMLAVHILLKILISFTSILLFMTLWGHYLLTLLISILVLDCSTCFLQSYIFIFLSLIYLSNVLIMH